MSPRNDPLRALEWHWGEAYAIYNPAPDGWIAIRRDDHTTLYDTTPTGLRDRIVADYSARPVARQDDGQPDDGQPDTQDDGQPDATNGDVA